MHVCSQMFVTGINNIMKKCFNGMVKRLLNLYLSIKDNFSCLAKTKLITEIMIQPGAMVHSFNPSRQISEFEAIVVWCCSLGCCPMT